MKVRSLPDRDRGARRFPGAAGVIRCCGARYINSIFSEAVLFAHPPAQAGDGVFAVHLRDEAGADLGWANRFAFINVGAIAETFLVHLPNHAKNAARALRLTLRQEREMGNLRGGE